MSTVLPAWRMSAAARLAIAACASIPAVASAQLQYYFESFEGASRTSISADPTYVANCSGGGAVWTDTFPAGWVVNDCGVPSYYCRVGLPQNTCPNTGICNPACLNDAGIIEWEGWAIADKDFWVRVAGDQNRALFTLGTGRVAIADPDEWDDELSPVGNCGFYNAFVTSPTIDISSVTGTLSLALASSWRPEAFDDGDGSNNQTGTIDAVFSTPGGDVVVQVLKFDSDPASPTFHGDNENEQVNLNGIAIPPGATAVKFKLGLTNAGNDWWWAVDNLVLTGDVSGTPTNLWAENFEGVSLLPPQEEAGGTPCALAYCNVPVYTHTAPGGMSVVTDTLSTGGVPDWAGWSFTEVAFWNCMSGQNRGQFVLGDGVVAIADGDEWTDISPNSGTLNTLLATPPIDIAQRQGNTLVLGFDSSWRDESGQTAVITAEYQTPSGTQIVEVARFESDPFVGADPNPNYKASNLSEQFNTPLIVPPAATSVVIKFQYTAGNNWWWAIDDIRVFQGVVTIPINNEVASQAIMALAPSIDYQPCFGPWSPTPPAGWTEADFFPIGCSLECGRAEWRGWSFANREWWSTNVDDQARSEFTRGRGYVAIADPDEWDDRGNNLSLFDAFLTSPTIALPPVISSISFNLDSSWRPECCDDGVNSEATAATGIGAGQNNQTATIKAIYQTPGGEVVVPALIFQSDPALPNFHPDATNEAVTLDAAALNVPTGATSVRFEFSLTKARNDWWWAVDNLAFNVNGSTLFSEDFENPASPQTAPTENPPTTLCVYYATVAQQNSGYTTTFVPTGTCSGAPDFQGWSTWLTDAWARAGGAPRGQFGDRTAYVSDFAQLGCDGVNTLASAAYDIGVINEGTLKLSFRSGWGSEAGHTSTVEVSYDNGTTWTSVLSWNPGNKSTTPDELVEIPLSNPAGASSVRFRFVDRDSGYWALSQILLSGDIGSPSCAGDFNFDGNLDPDDLGDFINCYFGETSFPGSCPDADFNDDGSIDPDDLGDYINTYFAGC